MTDAVDRMIERLILEGVMEVSGIDSDSGEFLYGFTPELEEKYPELATLLRGSFDLFILELVSLGFLELDMTTEMVTLTDKCFDRLELYLLEKDNPSLRSMLKTIMARFEEQE